MRKLTLDQAAEELQIKRDAVYKRVQRGTLPHTKDSDGRVYVYLDTQKDQKDADKKPGPEKSEDSNENQPHSWLEYVAAGTGAIALLGGMTYGLGLLELWIPIWRTYTNDGTAAWFGASLVPKTVVAGLGTAQLVALPTVLVAFLLVGSLITAHAANYFGNRWGRVGSGIVIELVVLAGAVATAWQLTTQTGVYSFSNLSSHDSATVGIVYFVGTNLLLVSIVIAAQRRRSRTTGIQGIDEVDTTPASGDASEASSDGTAKTAFFDPISSGPRWWFWPAIFLASTYISAGFNITQQEPALPTIEMSGEKAMDGALLTHTDGFWYVFDVAGKNKGQLIALRDDQVKTVKLSLENKSTEGH